ncbi:MAG TPA: hypothetical protein VFJ62_05440, partial [Usitatibacter sp.]|nr:hypothetical protein [Usitatibacter sp.]
TGLTVAPAPALVNGCGGTVSGATAGSSAISLSGGAIASAGASCQVTLAVIAGVEGVYSNTTGGVSSSLGTGSASNTAVYIAPGLAKSFAPNTTGVGDVTRMTITISNPSSSTTLTNLAFADTYPAGMTNTQSPSVSSSCSGSVTGGAANGGSIGLSGGRVEPGGTCSISVNVSASAVASYYNQTGTVRSSQGVGGYAADTLYVTAKPLITKSFAPATVTVGGTSTLSLTVENNNGASAITALAFSDAFPAGLVVAPAPALTNTCGGSVSGATAGSATIGLAGGTLAANARCTITVAVTSATAGVYANQASGATSAETGATPGPKSNIALLTVNLPAPTVAKSFAASPVGINTDVAMTITLTNANATPVTGVSFTDTYPPGLVNSGTPNLASDCGGAATAAAGSASLTLSGGTIPASGSCTVTVNVQAPAAGTYTNQTGVVAAANANNGASASATLIVLAPLAIAKSFSTATAGPGVPVVATITLTNPNALPVTGVAFTDAYPTGLANTATPAAATSCPSGTVAAAANGTSLAFGGGTVPANGSCTVTVNVAAAGTGSYTNLLPVGSVTTGNAGTNTAAASATVNVLATLTATKAFSPAAIGAGDASLLTITLVNANASPVTGATFTDNYPPGLVNMAAANASTTCGGTLTAANNGTSVALANGTVPANGSCTVTVAVTSATPGTYVNSTGAITSANAGAAAAASGTLKVLAHPTIAKAFSVSPINPGGASTLTVTIANANAAPITLASVTDTFPAGLVTAASPNIVNGCGGAVTSAAGSVTLTGGGIAANGACSFSIDVTSSVGGASLVNTIPAGALTSSAGSNSVAASATLDVRPEAELSITKTAAATVPAGGTVTYTIVVSNAGPQAANGAQLSDVVPGVLGGVAAVCGGGTGGAACGPVNVSGNAVTSTISTLPAGASVTFTVTATAPAAGTFANSASVVTPAGVFDPTDPNRTGAGNNSATAGVAVVSPDLRVAKSHTGSFTVGLPGTYTITVDNALGTAATSGAITVVDTLPAGLAYASASGAGWSCAAAGPVVTCTSSAVIPAGATNASAITLTVAVGSTAVGSVTNAVAVSGGGEPAANAGNNSAYDPTLVVAAATNAFAPDNAQTTGPGTAVSYAHVFTAGSAGSVSFSTSSVTTPATSGWTQQVYRDSDCNGVLSAAEAAAMLSGPIAVNPGDNVCIIVRDNVPVTAAFNAVNVITVTATFTGGLTYARTDTTTVGAATGSGLTLAKSVRNLTLGGTAGTANTARPNDVLEYTITYTNTSAGALSAIVVTDATPAFTTFVAASCNALPAGIAGCAATTVPAAGGIGSVVWTLTGSLISSGSGSVVYTVRVAP